MKKFLATLLIVVLMVVAMPSAMAAERALPTLPTFVTNGNAKYTQIMSTMQARIVNGVDGNDMSWQSTWYYSLGDEELLARLIYAAAPYWKGDKESVAMVIWNRLESPTYANSIRSIIATAGEFPQITGNASQTLDARVIDITTESWQNALKYACYLCSAVALNENTTVSDNVTAYMLVNEVYTQPNIVTDYLRFMNDIEFYRNAGETADDEPYVVINGTTHYLEEIKIPLYEGVYYSVSDAYMAYTYNNDPYLPSNSDENRVNMFFKLSTD